MITYREHMEQVIEPYLNQRRKVRWLEREEGKKIYCASFRLKYPRGVVLLSHGFTESAEKWKEVIYRFLKQGYSVYMPEHCGHGNSYRMTEDLSLVHVDSYERYVDDFLMAARLVRKENPYLSMYLFGHSMGGGIAAAAAAKEPYWFKKVILSAPMIRPNTGKIPWKEVVMMTKAYCTAGKSEQYLLGHHPYEGPKTLERSSSMREPQNNYYQEKRAENPLLQMNAASFGWMNAAIKLNGYLQTEGYQKIKAPVLLFQAELENRVCNKEQRRFMIKLRKAGLTSAKLVKVPNAKHELFNADKHTREAYWRMVFRFLET